MYLCSPFFYFFIRNVVENKTGLTKKDWIHFLPAVIHFVDLFPFYFESVQTKTVFATTIVTDHTQISSEADGIIPIQFHYLFRIFLQTLYFIYSVYLLNKVHPSLFILRNWKQHVNRDFLIILICLGWLVSFQFIYAVFESLLLLEVIDLSVENYYLRRTSLIGLLGLNIFVNLRLGTSRLKIEEDSTINKQTKPKISPTQLVDANQQKSSEKIEVKSLLAFSKEEIELTKSKIISKLKDENFFTESGLTLNHFASHINTSPKLVSLVINKEFNTNFKEFLNQHRIWFAISKIEEGYLDDYTLVALGEISGFNSRTTFFNAFKKEKGCSPSEYWKKFQESIS
jgi:AraC-like DNA-binding protein